MSKTQRTPTKVDLLDGGSTHYGSDPNLCTSERPEIVNITRRVRRKIDPSLTGSEDVTDSSVESKIEDLRTSQDKRFDEITVVLSTLMNQSCEIQKSIQSMSTKYDTLMNKVESLEKENSVYKAQIQNLENKLQQVDKEAKSTSIEIRNVPKSGVETKKVLLDTVKKIALAVGTNPSFENSEVKDIYRTKSNTIVAQFTTVLTKQNLISTVKDYNKTRKTNKEPQLNTQCLGLPSAGKPIYISDHLTSKTRHIFYLARQLVKNKKLVAAWTYHGDVFIKKVEGDQPTRINFEEELDNLSSDTSS